MCDLYHHTDKKKERITQQFLCHQKTWEKKDLVHLFLTVQLIKRPNAMIMLAGRFIPSHTHTDKKGVNNITIFMPPENLRKKNLFIYLLMWRHDFACWERVSFTGPISKICWHLSDQTPWLCLLGASFTGPISKLCWHLIKTRTTPLWRSLLSLSLSPSFLSLSNSNFLLQLVQLQSVLATRSVLLLQ